MKHKSFKWALGFAAVLCLGFSFDVHTIHPGYHFGTSLGFFALGPLLTAPWRDRRNVHPGLQNFAVRYVRACARPLPELHPIKPAKSKSGGCLSQKEMQ